MSGKSFINASLSLLFITSTNTSFKHNNMKKLLYLLLFLVGAALQIRAQTANHGGFNFQGIARDAAGIPASERKIKIKASIIDPAGSTPYEETHIVSSDKFGLFSVAIGEGNVLSGNFSLLNWSGDFSYKLSISIDPMGGDNFSLFATTTLKSVPYAKYADNAGNAYWIKDVKGNLNYPGGNVGVNSVSDKALFTTAGSAVTQSVFGVNSAGISLQQSWPAIGFNHYFKDTHRSITKGHGGYIGVDAVNGGMYFRTFPLAAAEDQKVTLDDRMFISPKGSVGIGTIAPTGTLDVIRGSGLDGTAVFRGTKYVTQFNYSKTEDTYIRGGKDSSNIYLNDQNIGSVYMVNNGGKVNIGELGLTALYGTLNVIKGKNKATLTIAGTNMGSMFNFSDEEHTYVRGGKFSSKVFINDASNGPTIISQDDESIVYIGPEAVISNKDKYKLYVRGSASKFPVNVENREANAYGITINNLSSGTGILINGGRALSADGQIYVGSVACIGNISYGGSLTNVSDARFKQNIKAISSPLSKVLKLNGVNYYYRRKDFPDRKFSDQLQIGFIAQEVRSIVPEIVSEDEKGYLSVDYSKVTPLLVEAMKEQNAVIETQKSEIEKLNKEIESLKSQNSSLIEDVDIIKAQLQEILNQKASLK